MKQYQELLEEVLETGVQKGDRTGTGTISKFITQKRYDLRDGFPLVTTKKTAFRLIVLELLWFLRGETNMSILLQDDVNIWNDDAYKQYVRYHEEVGQDIVSQKEFIELIKTDEDFAAVWGELGPIYGKQWRNFQGPNGGIDQIMKLINDIKRDPNSRRLLVIAWNPDETDDMALPPCHILIQVYVENGNVSLHLYQRSGDLFLGVPFNIASYALLLELIAKQTGLVAAEFVHTIGDTHLYNNHIEQAKLQLTREPRELPTLNIYSSHENIWDYQLEDFELIGYDPHPKIKAEQSS